MIKRMIRWPLTFFIVYIIRLEYAVLGYLSFIFRIVLSKTVILFLVSIDKMASYIFHDVCLETGVSNKFHYQNRIIKNCYLIFGIYWQLMNSNYTLDVLNF